MRILAGDTSQVVVALGPYVYVLTLAGVGGDRGVTVLIHLSNLLSAKLAAILFVLSHLAAACGFQRAAHCDKEARLGVSTCSEDTRN